MIPTVTKDQAWRLGPFQGRCTGSGCGQPVGSPHTIDCETGYAVDGDPMPCCEGFRDGRLGWSVWVIDTPLTGVQVSFGSYDDSVERMRFCPWCGKRFEVAP